MGIELLKLQRIIACAGLVMSLAACGDNGGSSASAAESGSAEASRMGDSPKTDNPNDLTGDGIFNADDVAAHARSTEGLRQAAADWNKDRVKCETSSNEYTKAMGCAMQDENAEQLRSAGQCLTGTTWAPCK